MTQTFGDKVIDFNRHLEYSEKLPENFKVINPYLDNPETIDVMQQFIINFIMIQINGNSLSELILVAMELE